MTPAERKAAQRERERRGLRQVRISGYPDKLVPLALAQKLAKMADDGHVEMDDAGVRKT